MIPIRSLRALLVLLVFTFFYSSISPAQTPPEQIGYCDVPGGKIWYKISGSGSKAPLLCLHGGPGSTSCTLAPLDSLGDERPVIRFDQLGSGRSDRPMDSALWHLDRFVEQLSVLVDHLQLKEYHLYGHSWGGALAVVYMLTKHPKHVKSLILASPLISTPLWLKDAARLLSTLPDSTQDIIRRNEAAGTTNSPQYQQAVTEYYQRCVYRGTLHRPAECTATSSNPLIYNFMWGPSEFSASGNLRTFDREADLVKLQVPVLLIVGEFDEARPETMQHFQQLIPNATLTVIPGAAHMGMDDQPVEYVKQLRHFLRNIESQ